MYLQKHGRSTNTNRLIKIRCTLFQMIKTRRTKSFYKIERKCIFSYIKYDNEN